MEVHSPVVPASCLDVVANEKTCLGSGSLLSSPAVDSGRDTPKMMSSFKKTSAVGDVAADLLEEVTHALTKLQNSLNQGELALDESKRTALLSLVDRLTQGLISPMKSNETTAAVDSTDSGVNETMPQQFEQPSTERRGSTSSGGRFAKRRNRNNRHTVGVTREELADARRIIEELELIGLQNAAAVASASPSSYNKPKVTATLLNSNSAGVYNAILTRQISEPVTLLRPSQFLSQDDTKKPFKVVLKQSISVDQPSSILKNAYKQEMKPATDTEENSVVGRTKEFLLQRSSSGSASGSKTFAQRTKNRVEKKTTTTTEAATTDDESEKSSSSDDEENDIKTKLSFKSFKARENYLRNQRSIDNATCNYSSGDEASASGVRPSKYVSKKMKMRRSNTVNLPKSFSFVNTFDVSDRECSDVESKENFKPKKLPNNVGLSTTFTGNMVQQPIRPPSFEAKTENDKKFLAFINKQNKDQVIPAYVNPAGERAAKTQNWTNKFGNLKNRFEGDETPLPPMSPQKPPVNAAANFWKCIEKTKPSAKVSPMMSNTQSPHPHAAPASAAKSFPIVSEKFPWKTEKVVEKIAPVIISNDEQNVSKKMQMLENSSKLSAEAEKASKVNHEINKLPPSAFTPAKSVNNFTHAPMSAFKPPISRKLSNSFKPILGNSEEVVKKSLPSVTNGIVKQMAENGFSQSQNVASVQPRKVTNSPTRNIASVDSAFTRVVPKAEKVDNQPMPWAGKTKTDRVLSLASAKFEQVPTVHLNKALEPAPDHVKFRANPLYNSTYEKRSSLPPNASFATYEHLTAISHDPNAPPKSNGTFVITDYTPSSVSTFALDTSPAARPVTLNRQDSLTNPEKEPLVLTCDRSSFAPPYEQQSQEIANISNSTSTENVLSNGSEVPEDISNGDDNGVEYQAAVAKVMKSPVAHSAVVQSSEIVSLNDINKENLMMKNIHDSLKKFSQKSPEMFTKKRLSQDSSCSSLDNMKQRFSPRLSNDSSHSSIDQQLGAIKIPIPAVPETAYSFTYNPSPPKINIKSPSIDPSPHVKFNNVSNLQRTRSNYMLNVPQVETRPTPSPSVSPVHLSRLSNFFSPQSPMQRTPEPVLRSPHQVKRFAANSSLSRSKTMPSIPKKVELLDETNVEDAFEELLSSSNL